MMAQSRRPGHRNGPLQRRRLGDRQRLRTSQDVGTAALEGGRYRLKMLAIGQLAVTVNDQDRLRPFACRAPTLRPALDHRLGFVSNRTGAPARSNSSYDLSRSVRRIPVDNQQLETVLGILLVQQHLERLANVRFLVTDRNDDRQEQRTPDRLGSNVDAGFKHRHVNRSAADGGTKVHDQKKRRQHEQPQMRQTPRSVTTGTDVLRRARSVC